MAVLNGNDRFLNVGGREIVNQNLTFLIVREEDISAILEEPYPMVISDATWQSPHQYASGMEAVFVSGKPAILEGIFTNSFNGSLLTRSQH